MVTLNDLDQSTTASWKHAGHQLHDLAAKTIAQSTHTARSKANNQRTTNSNNHQNNRRTNPAGSTDSPTEQPPLDLGLAYHYALHFAQLHPGYDAFVVPQHLLPQLVSGLGDVLVGYPPVGSMVAEVVSNAHGGCVMTKHIPTLSNLTYHNTLTNCHS